MNLSQRGLDLIKSFEGYHRRLPNGDCIAYRCPANVLTLGYGCTKGIKPGMIWTEQQAQDALAKELVGHEQAVLRLVSVDLNQNQFDALVSFAYNCGNGALEKSGLLKKLNAGDFPGAQAEFMKWNKAAGKVLRGLSIRRAKEAALFAERVEEDEADPLPQALDAPPEPMSPKVAHTINTVGTTGVTQAATGGLPKPPPAVAESLSTITSWQGLGRGVSSMATTVLSSPALMLLVVGLFGAMLFGSNIASYFGRK